MNALTESQLHTFFDSLVDEYEIYLPVRLADGTRIFGKLGSGETALYGGRLSGKPGRVFFPQCEQFLTISKTHEVKMTDSGEKPLLVIGFTYEDLCCLEFTDYFYSTDFSDGLYIGKRERSVVAGISGWAGNDGKFMKISGGRCDFELIADNETFIILPYSEKGKILTDRMPEGREIDSIAVLQKNSDCIGNDMEGILEKASELIKKNKVPENFWQKVADDCINCGSCIFACPTCTCFECYELERGNDSERYRMWDSCLLDGFMREASGHNPFGTETRRSLRRIRHKLIDDRIKWGRISCFLCGRCDDICPTGLGIQEISRKIVERYG